MRDRIRYRTLAKAVKEAIFQLEANGYWDEAKTVRLLWMQLELELELGKMADLSREG